MFLQDQIVATYEECGASVDEIARAMDMESSAIKLALTQGSAKYRKAAQGEIAMLSNASTNGQLAGVGVELQQESSITDDEFRDIKNGLLDIGLRASNEGVRAKALIFLWNEYKGRNSIQAGRIPDSNVNVNMFNVVLQKAKAAVEAGRNKVIELA